MRLLTLLLLAACLPGCAGRVGKVFAPEAHVLPEHPVGALAEVRYDTGYRRDPPQVWSAPVLTHAGRRFTAPITLTTRGWLAVDPLVEGATVRVYLRHNSGLVPSDFQPLVAVTGGLPGALPNEIRPLDTRLRPGWRLPLRQLHNVYNDFEFQDGDLLLLEVEAPDAAPERYLFRTRKLGLRSKAGVGVLVRVPLPGGERASVSPAFAATAALGYRPRTRNPVLSWAGDKLAVVGSLGVGSTAVLSEGGEVDARFGTVLNAALAGGGLEVYDILSVQVLANLSALGRERAEEAATLAIGFDAVQFGRFTRDLFRRLLSDNSLDED